MLKANDQTFDATVLQASRPVLVDFVTTWCPPCRQQKPILEKLAARRTDVDVVCVDLEESPEVAAKYGVTVVPTLMVFVGGERKAIAHGLQSERKLDELLPA
jgi:thioredoxin 1